MRAGFSPLDWSAPLDLQAAYAAVPADATVRGMFPQGVLDECVRAGLKPPVDRKYVGFKAYPLTEFMEVLVASAEVLFPGQPPRQQLRRLGQLAYPTLLQSMAGKAIFGMVGGQVDGIMRLAPKAYAVSLSPGTAEAVEVSANSAVLHFRDMHNFLDSYQVGVVEGAILACQRQGDVTYRAISLSEGEMFAQWR